MIAPLLAAAITLAQPASKIWMLAIQHFGEGQPASFVVQQVSLYRTRQDRERAGDAMDRVMLQWRFLPSPPWHCVEVPVQYFTQKPRRGEQP